MSRSLILKVYARQQRWQALIKSEIERINLSLAQVETLKKFRLIDKQLTVEDDELTASMKLKRNVVNEKYADLIDQMYS